MSQPAITPEALDPVFREHFHEIGITVRLRRIGGRLELMARGRDRYAACDVDDELFERVGFCEEVAAAKIFDLADGLVAQVTRPEPEPRPGIGRGEG